MSPHWAPALSWTLCSMTHLLSHSSSTGEATSKYRLNYDLEANENQLSPSCKQTNKTCVRVFWKLNIKPQATLTGRFCQTFSGSGYFSTLLVLEVRGILKEWISRDRIASERGLITGWGGESLFHTNFSSACWWESFSFLLYCFNLEYWRGQLMEKMALFFREAKWMEI